LTISKSEDEMALAPDASLVGGALTTSPVTRSAANEFTIEKTKKARSRIQMSYSAASDCKSANMGLAAGQ
jgi:hypothetical protein